MAAQAQEGLEELSHFEGKEHGRCCKRASEGIHIETILTEN